MNVAVSAAIRRSAARASENPPPAAAPCTLATTGAGSRCNPSVAAWKWSMSSPIAAAATLRSPPNIVMSPPATNAFPAPCNTTARTSSRDSRCSTTSRNARAIARSIAFNRSGRLKVTKAARWSTCSSMGSLMADI